MRAKPQRGGKSLFPRGIVLERLTREGNSPVLEREQIFSSPDLSTIGHGKSGGNPGGSPPKAKYYPVTDSGQVP